MRLLICFVRGDREEKREEEGGARGRRGGGRGKGGKTYRERDDLDDGVRDARVEEDSLDVSVIGGNLVGCWREREEAKRAVLVEDISPLIKDILKIENKINNKIEWNFCFVFEHTHNTYPNCRHNLYAASVPPPVHDPTCHTSIIYNTY